MTKNKSGIWSFFSSVQLAISLLALIALFALVGTLVPQRDGAAQLADTMSPGFFSFLQKMQIFDLYHSIWFFLLMGLLAINLIICSLDRFPMVWRRFRHKPSPRDDDVFKNIPEENILQTDKDATTAANIAAALLKKRFRHLERADEPKSIFMCTDKGRFSHFGVYIVHLSIIVLIVGAIVGAIFGLEGYVNITEGETANTIDLKSGNRTLPLPFAVRCDKFTLKLYENGAPQTYQSDLTFLKDNRIVHSGKLLVNHPITFEGFRFYQSSYGPAPEGRATLTLLANGKKIRDISVGLGETFSLPGFEGKVEILRIEENLMKMGPAVKLVVHGTKGDTALWVFQYIEKIKEMNPDIIARVPMFNPGLFQPYLFVLAGMQEKYYTGLQVSRDPGTPVVAFAAVLLIIGLMLVLFSYYRQVWIRIDQGKEKVRIRITGRSYRNKAGLERELQYLLAEIKYKLENSK